MFRFSFLIFLSALTLQAHSAQSGNSWQKCTLAHLMTKVFMPFTRCSQCFSCFNNATGQVIEAVCFNDYSAALSCFAQFKYLYLYQNNGQNLPCYGDCSRCLIAINGMKLPLPEITTSIWKLAFPNFFNRSTLPVSPGCLAPTDTSSPSRSLPVSMVRIKRTTDATCSCYPEVNDLNACCDTTRCEQPYITPYIENGSQEWFPVRFSLHGLLFYQYHDLVTCGLTQSSCCESSCTLVEMTKVYLFTTIRPEPYEGNPDIRTHDFIIIAWPYLKVKFIPVPVHVYCKCST